MAQDIFLKVDGIEGESKDEIHINEIDVISWRWRVSQQSSMHSGSGGGAAKASVSDLEFTHMIDRASPNLAKYCHAGKHIPEAKLTMRKSGGLPHEFIRITMYDVIVSHVEPIAGGEFCSEEVKLSFARKKHEYILQNSLGGPGGTVTALIDVKANRSS